MPARLKASINFWRRWVPLLQPQLKTNLLLIVSSITSNFCCDRVHVTLRAPFWTSPWANFKKTIFINIISKLPILLCFQPGYNIYVQKANICKFVFKQHWKQCFICIYFLKMLQNFIHSVVSIRKGKSFMQWETSSFIKGAF